MTVTKRLPARFIDMRPLTRRKAAPQAGRLLRLAAFALVLSGCGAAPATPLAHAASGAAASPVTLSCTTSGLASAAWPQPWTRSTVDRPIRNVTLSADTLTFRFDRGTPAFQVTPQSTARFHLNTGKSMVPP